MAASLNTSFTIRNDQNTLGRILSGGNDLVSLFSPIALQTYVQNNSSSWAGGGSGATNLGAASANWQNTYTYFSQQSANNLGVYTQVNILSSNWQNTYTYFNQQSANNLSVYSLVNTSTAGTFNLNNVIASGTITASSLNLGVPATSTVFNVPYLTIVGSNSGSVYNQIQNTYAGVSASTDLVVTNDGGINYLDIGINSSAYNGSYNPNFNVTKAGDSYVYATSSNLVIGAADVSGNVTVFTGGTTTANERLRITNTGNVGIGTTNPAQPLSVVGNISSSNIVYATNGNSTNWNSAYTDTQAATNSYTANTIVKRDANGGFSAGAITANLSGTATKVSNPLTFSNNGLGNASGTAYDGSTPYTISYNTIGAAPLSGSSNVTIVGTVSSGEWKGSIIAVPYGGTGTNNGSITGTGALTYQATGTNNGITLTPGSGGSVSITNIAASGSGSITGTTISGSTGSFTTLGASSAVTLNPAGANVSIQPSSGGTVTINPNGQGTLDNMVIGGGTAAAGTFTSLQVNNNAQINGNLSLNGTLYLQGTAVYENASSLVVQDPLIYLAENNPGDLWDIGIAGHMVGNNGYSHTGLLRSHPSTYNAAGSAVGTWYLFSSMSAEPSTNNIFNNTKVIDTLVANISGSLTGNASTATALLNPQNVIITGDIVPYQTSFNGTSSISLSAIIGNNAVTYPKMQKISKSFSVLGNSSGNAAQQIAEIDATTIGFNLLASGSADAGAHYLGLGKADIPTWQGITINNTGTDGGTTSVPLSIIKNFYKSTATSAMTVTTVPSAPYQAAKLLVRFAQLTSGGAVTDTGVFELLTHYDARNAQWDYTIYGLIDPSNLLSPTSTGITIGSSTSTIDLGLTFVSAPASSGTYTASVICTGLV